MPNPKGKRSVVLQMFMPEAPVSVTNVTLEASFTTETATASTLSDASSGDEEETEHRVRFVGHAGEVGELTVRLTVKGDPGQASVTVVKSAKSECDPPVERGAVTMIADSHASFERAWKQAILDGNGAEVVDAICKVDVRVAAAHGYSVGQTVMNQADDRLALRYQWRDASGATVALGGVTLETSSTAEEDFHLGRIRVTDNDPDDSRIGRAG